MNTKELLTDNDFIESLAESLEDTPQDSGAKYDLWVIGHNRNGYSADELFIYEFETSEEAIAKAETIDLKFVAEQVEAPLDSYCDYCNINKFTVEVETVVDDEEGDAMNIGTIYKRDLWIDGEYGSEEDLPEIEEPFIGILSSDVTILDDGTLKIKCDMLKDYNKNDFVNFYFIDEPDTSILTYKIVSKVIYTDGDYYHCELNI